MRRDDKSLSVLVCRGCCCGSYAKHPDVDHARHLSSLTSAMASVPGAKVWAVDCLDSCERSNVVVVRTSGQRRWFGEMLTDADVETLAGWLRSGAPGETPTDLLPHIFDPDSLTPATPPMAPLKEGELLDWIVDALAVGGGWTVGCHAAVGEFDSTGASVIVERSDDGSGGTVTARTATGEMRLRVSSDTRAFFVGSEGPAAEPVLVVLASVTPGDPQRPEATIVRSTLGSIEVLTTGVGQPSAHIHPLPDPDDDQCGDSLPFGIVLPKGFTPGAVHFRRLPPALIQP
jgi:hypothetical protein